MLCNDTSKFKIIAYILGLITDKQINAIAFFLNDNLKKNDKEREWEDFKLSINEVVDDLKCYTFSTKGGRNNPAKKLRNLYFFPIMREVLCNLVFKKKTSHLISVCHFLFFFEATLGIEQRPLVPERCKHPGTRLMLF